MYLMMGQEEGEEEGERVRKGRERMKNRGREERGTSESEVTHSLDSFIFLLIKLLLTRRQVNE